jgi:hypothetical protein
MKTQLLKSVSSKTILILCLFMGGNIFAQVSMTSPNGGENWNVGSSHNVSWFNLSASGGDSLSYSIDNGVNWINIGKTSSPYAWVIPNTPSGQCLMKVTLGSGASDVSNATFSITAVGAGVNESFSSNTLNVYPIPANNYVNISGEGLNELQSVSIYNSVGSLVAEYTGKEQFISPVVKINLNDFSKGVYTITLDNGKSIVNKKIIVL